MRRSLWRGMLLGFVLLGAYPACAEESPSLFLTPSETLTQNPFHQATTRLDAIVYYGPGQWQVWIDGRALTPGGRDSAVTIQAVSSEAVRFKQRLGDQEREIVLAPHQVYLWAENKIVEAGAAAQKVRD